MRSEREVLIEQLDELLGEPVVDEEDALEVAIVAGGAARLGAGPEELADAVAWRDGRGADLIASLWEMVDAGPLLEALEAASEGVLEDELIEEAVYDVDDLLVAALWCGRPAIATEVGRKAEAIVQQLPDVFEDLAPEGRTLLRRREVAEALDAFGMWLVIAEAAG